MAAYYYTMILSWILESEEGKIVCSKTTTQISFHYLIMYVYMHIVVIFLFMPIRSAEK